MTPTQLVEGLHFISALLQSDHREKALCHSLQNAAPGSQSPILSALSQDGTRKALFDFLQVLKSSSFFKSAAHLLSCASKRQCLFSLGDQQRYSKRICHITLPWYTVRLFQTPTRVVLLKTQPSELCESAQRRSGEGLYS
eukprot:gb/GEZJ01003942.1/.p1 GENE.gb/GEZJ01003942.1/~~gb/GEZJ01003942.1/.p1  ORF type:complete len:140 (-),score=13.92 gb/GEZJ01003942.1/:228-647(-)